MGVEGMVSRACRRAEAMVRARVGFQARDPARGRIMRETMIAMLAWEFRGIWRPRIYKMRYFLAQKEPLWWLNGGLKKVSEQKAVTLSAANI